MLWFKRDRRKRERRKINKCKILMSFTFSPITFWPLISQICWSVRRPLRAAELSFTIEVIRPFLKRKPSCPFMSLWRVTVRSNGLQTVIVFSVLVYNYIMNMHMIVYKATFLAFFFVKWRNKMSSGVLCRLSFFLSSIASLHPFPYMHCFFKTTCHRWTQTEWTQQGVMMADEIIQTQVLKFLDRGWNWPGLVGGNLPQSICTPVRLMLYLKNWPEDRWNSHFLNPRNRQCLQSFSITRVTW